MFAAKLLIFLLFVGLLFYPQLQAKCFSKKNGADYVIVGVGTAGAVLAKELTDDKKTSVIALHIGENLTQDPTIKFSENAFLTVLSAIVGPPFFENGETVPQPNADNRELLWVLALPLGGASSINAGAYCRETDQLNAEWEAIAGPNWSPEIITALYKKLEDYHGETTNPAARGFHGPLDIRQVACPTEISKKFNQAVINGTGVPFVLDYNDPDTPIGSSTQLQYTQKGANGVLRVSSATAFLNRNVMTPHGRGVGGRKLRVLFETTGLRTIWKGNKAIGVEYLRHGHCKKVYAKKGVIVCCGLQSSPFLLHSGIGPKPLLESLDIPVIFDNPNVGQGLAEQPGIRTIFTSNPADTPVDNMNSIFSQISWLPAPGGDPIKRELRFATVNPIPGITLALFDLCQPHSRGSVTINSADPLAPPIIDLGIFNDPADLQLLQQGFQIYIKNINLALQAIDPTYQLIFPDPAIIDNLPLLTQFIKENIGSNQHFQSHCRMAPFAEGGVVDSTGHVYGVQNLIVADDSISPLDMDGSPMASAYLFATNIARLLKENRRN